MTPFLTMSLRHKTLGELAFASSFCFIVACMIISKHPLRCSHSDRSRCFMGSDIAEKAQNDVGAVHLMNEAMKKTANRGFLLFLIFLRGVNGCDEQPF